MDLDPQGAEEPHPKRRKVDAKVTIHPSYCETHDIEALEAAKQQNSEPDQACHTLLAHPFSAIAVFYDHQGLYCMYSVIY